MSLLTRIFTTVNKQSKSVEEEIDIREYIQPHAFSAKVEMVPFKHVVIDNFFREDFVKSLTEYYNGVFSKGLSNDPSDLSRFHSFEAKINYDGFVFPIAPTSSFPLQLFFSVQWNLFFSKLFRKPTTFGTNFALHHHSSGDRTGWVHNDYATYFFPHKLILPNGVTGTRGEEGEVKLSRGESLASHFKQKRSIALIYYFNSPEWKEGNGGETGLYHSKDPNSLVKKVAPVNNRLLAFDISPSSFHAFQENLKDRNTVIQWFHSDLDWCEKEYGFL